jgi:hypothetical protein
MSPDCGQRDRGFHSRILILDKRAAMPWITIPTEAVDRIIKSVGPKVTLLRPNADVVGPPDPNKDLSYRLHQSLRWYYVARERRSDAGKKLQVRRLVAISKAALKLRSLLKSDENSEWLNSIDFEVLRHGVEISIPIAQREVYELEMKIKYGDDYDTEYLEGRDLRDLMRTRSPFEWLVGTYLADDYRVCFGKDPTLSRTTDGTLGGPFIRFVEGVLAEFDVTNGSSPYGREAIAKALIDARKGRYRRPASA